MSAARRAAVAERDAARAAATGSGPRDDASALARFPGATSWFALLGETLLVGIVVAVGSLLVVTAPAALAAGVRHLRRYVHAEASGLALFWRDLRAALLGGIGVGFAVVILTAVGLFALGLAGGDPSPIGRIMLFVALFALLAAATATALAAGAWQPSTGWRTAVSGLRGRLDADPAASLYIAGAVLALALLTWQLPPLIVPGLGLLALALVAVPERRRRGDAHDAEGAE